MTQIQYSTPTPGADGRIIYIVQAGDNCLRVAALHGITEGDLRSLNSKLDADCMLTEGQELLIGLGGVAVTPISGPPPTPAPPTTVPTPFSGTTEICVLLFNDQNGDSLRQETEPAVAGGAVSVTEKNGAYSATLETIIVSDPVAYQGICFTNVPEGDYNISMGVPSDYNATMSISYNLQVKAGDIAFVDFGVQSIQTSLTGDESTQKGTSPLFAIFGALLLLGGAGLGWDAWQSARPESKLGGGGILKK
ncbi:MAG: LysM peptidoglycan-binding domain-containing protein [Anaerolineales bacterium]|nr:LysM peptidoglycan-binding domain-containing protein [Anaerolineales bacterium]